MVRVKTEVKFNAPRAIAMIKAAGDVALTVVGDQALQDANIYVPKSAEETLKDSSIEHSDIKAVDGEYILRWSTPYAQYLWHGDVMFGNPTNRKYGPKKISFTDALAYEEWAKHAAEVHGEKWKEVFQKALERRLGE